MLYIPVTTEKNAEQLARKLYKLSRPNTAVHPHDVTKYLAPWHVHPTTAAVVVGIPEDLLHPIHPDADEDSLDDLILPFVPTTITTDDHKKIKDKIKLNKGKKANLWEAWPQFWKDHAKTHAQLQAEGWFPDDLDLISPTPPITQPATDPIIIAP